MIVTMISGQVLEDFPHLENRQPDCVSENQGAGWQSLAIAWNVAVFDAALIAQLNDVEEGTPISAVGPSSADIYQAKGGGEARVSFHLTAERLLTLR